ncbi:hypothetical protein [Tellurirhabdus rosea]|uniref:hypothetical protein n=1 Tax=Tellurirhabdus rosea TaxID=2674997 RepID=UPI0022538EDA|nr:hypothetical protein [Tellurirhabdus rosea]
MLSRLQAYFQSGNALTVAVRKNVLLTVLIKAAGFVLNLVFIPLTLSLLSTELYGVWLTLSSMVAWFLFIDFGLGNGLRNKLTQLLSQGEHAQARTYVSTLYTATGVIALTFCLLYVCVHPFIDWAGLLKVAPRWNSEVSTLALIAFMTFGLELLLRNITFVLLAVHKSAVNSLFPLLSNLTTLGLILAFRPWLEGSLLHVGLALLVPQIVVLAGFHLYFFRGELRYLSPSIGVARRETLRHFGGLGLSFFILQLSFSVIFTTTNLLITRLLGPAYVAQYEVAFRYFGFLPMGFNIALNPLWSAFGEAYFKRDVEWIEGALRRMQQLWGLVTAGQVALLALSGWLIPRWVGNSVAVPLTLAGAMLVYYALTTFGTIYVSFLNGIGQVRYQLIAATGAILLMIPLAYALVTLAGLGLVGMLAAICLCSSYSFLVAPFETRQVLRKLRTSPVFSSVNESLPV